jgi:hypothetical protein
MKLEEKIQGIFYSGLFNMSPISKQMFYFLIDVHNLFGYTQTIATHIAMLQARPSNTLKNI